MANDLHALANRLEKRAEQIKVEASNAAVSAAMTIVGDLAFTTPVDTSEAVSNCDIRLRSVPLRPLISLHTFPENWALRGMQVQQRQSRKQRLHFLERNLDSLSISRIIPLIFQI